jgi:hypothetical protein
MAYHPTNPVNDPSLWHFDYSYNASCDTWDEFTGADRLETCPVGWRRPTVGNITSLYNTQPADGSELMQSLFYTTFDGSGSLTNSNNYRYFGYYADGYFDRRPVEDGLGQNFATKSAVSASTTNAAYIGLLFTHPTTKASLFVPGAGSRNANNGSLHDTGSYGYFFSSSAYNADYGWSLSFMSSVANQTFKYRPYGFTVRCVAE